MAKTGNNFFGFTLLELAMVCAILSLGGLIVFPRIQGAVFDWNRKAEAQKMRSVIRETQHRALTQQTSYRIEFQPITRKYDIQRDNSGTFETVETIDMLPHVYFMTTPVCEADTLEFDLMGTPAISCPYCMIYLADTNDNVTNIQVKCQTGFVQVWN